MSRYGYLEEYKELIELEKIALKKACDIMNDNTSSKAEVCTVISKINEVVNTIKSIYQYMPQVLFVDQSRGEISRDKYANEPYDINKDPEAKF